MGALHLPGLHLARFFFRVLSLSGKEELTGLLGVRGSGFRAWDRIPPLLLEKEDASDITRARKCRKKVWPEASGSEVCGAGYCREVAVRCR